MRKIEIALYLPAEYKRRLDRLVAAGLYPSRSEAIRTAVLDLLRTETTWKCPVSERLLAEIKGANT